jgi:hypothetical protein
MSSDDIPLSVREFIEARIPSVGHMEALALTQEEPGETWTAARVAQRLYVPEKTALGFLRDLTASGILSGPGAAGEWRFAPVRPALADDAAATVRCYRQRLLPMTRLIQSRHDAATQLADAFRLRKE